MAGCSSDKWGFPYIAPVQQGNWITQEQIALLQPGMTREQVRFALGSPTLTSALHADRWDYPYYFKPGNGQAEDRQFTVWFDGNRLTRWDGDTQPKLQPFQLDATGKALEQADEEINAETARRDSQVTPGSALPADAAQLPALGTPPGGSIHAPSMGSDPSTSPASHPHLQMHSPESVSPSTNSAEPLR